MRQSTLTRLGVWLIVLASLGHILGYAVAVPEHIVDAAWPAHARFHVVQALLWLIGFDLVSLVLALGPLARGQAWARWALLMALMLSHGGYFIALIVIPEGHPPEGLRAHLPLAALLFMHAAGLGLAWRGPGRPGAVH